MKNEIKGPILRGRDIKRYAYNFSNMYLIASHNGMPDKGIPRVDITKYPAVKKHFDGYWGQISSRSDMGDTPYNLRSCAYMEDFNRQNIIYNDITQKLTFGVSNKGVFINNTVYFLRVEEYDINYLLGMLNSQLMDWYYRTVSVQLGEKAVRMFSIYVEQIPIPKMDRKDRAKLISLVQNNRDGYSCCCQDSIDKIVFSAYGLNNDEIQFIKNH